MGWVGENVGSLYQSNILVQIATLEVRVQIKCLQPQQRVGIDSSNGGAGCRVVGFYHSSVPAHIAALLVRVWQGCSVYVGNGVGWCLLTIWSRLRRRYGYRWVMIQCIWVGG